MEVDQGRVLATGRPSILNSWVDGPRKLQIGEILEEKEGSNMTGMQEFETNWLTVAWTAQDLFSN